LAIKKVELSEEPFEVKCEMTIRTAKYPTKNDKRVIGDIVSID
jgi:hypothetical protein